MGGGGVRRPPPPPAPVRGAARRRRVPPSARRSRRRRRLTWSSFPPPAGRSTRGRGRRRSACGGTSRPPTWAVGRRKACARRKIKFIKDNEKETTCARHTPYGPRPRELPSMRECTAAVPVRGGSPSRGEPSPTAQSSKNPQESPHAPAAASKQTQSRPQRRQRCEATHQQRCPPQKKRTHSAESPPTHPPPHIIRCQCGPVEPGCEAL